MGAPKGIVRKRRTGDTARFARSAVRIFAASERLNQILIEQLDPAAWTARPPGNVRTIAAIFTHMHNMRIKWMRLSAPHVKRPKQLSRARCTPRQARKGLAESAAGCVKMLGEALGEGRIKEFRRDVWATPWPVGAEMLSYMLAHEAHHRGQVCLLAHQIGLPLPDRATSMMWNWEKLWREAGAPIGAGR